MKTKYRVKLLNDFNEPYWMFGKLGPVVGHSSIDEYVLYDDKSTFYKVIDDFIDAPSKPLTEKDIQKDFSANRKSKLSKGRVAAIKAYYNGRLELKKAIYADLAKATAKKLKKGFPVVLKYSIPFEMNYFSCEDNDPHEALTSLNDSYIEIEISKEDDESKT